MSVTAIAAITIYTPYMGEVLQGWRQEGGRVFNGNLIPFRTIRSYLDSTPSFSVALQLLGNVALFTPLGFFLRLGAANRLSTALALGFGASVLTEALQYVLPTGRAIDVDDVILNTVGVVAGVLLASAFNGLIKRRPGVAAR
jgi:glycopeptide antibiotics resistance protein